jgi:hypothetical protein
VVSPGDTVRALFENFGGVAAVVDQDNVVHLAVNGYSLKVLTYDDTTGLADTVSNRFYTFYKKGSDPWKVISDKTVGASSEYDSAYYVYNGNAIGNAYPAISIDNAGNVFVAWSQAMFNGSKLDTNGGVVQYELWWNHASNGTWSTPAKLANSVGALFTSAAQWLTGTGSSRTAHFIYLADTVRGSVVFDGLPSVQTPWIYRTITFDVTTSVRPNITGNPMKFELQQNYPNPFNPTTNIRYSVPAAGLVTLTVYNAIGQEVASLVNEVQDAGSYVADFNASRLASGMYLYKIEAGRYTATKKMMLIK